LKQITTDEFKSALLNALGGLFRKIPKSAIIFGVYCTVAALVLSVIVLFSYVKFNLLSTGIVLGGWDTPIYMWHAKIVMQYGSWYYMSEVVQYPAFYPQLLALLGTSLGSVVFAQRVLPVILGILRIMLFSLMSYQISKNVHIAGLTAVLTSVSVGNLWLVGEYHRNSLALDLILIMVLLVSNSNHSRINKSQYFLLPLLSFLAAGTQFETLGIAALTLFMSAILVRNWRLLLLTFFSVALATGIIVLAFPMWFEWYYVNPAQVAAGAPVQHTYYDLIFWSIGTSALLPIAFFGMFNMYEEAKILEKRNQCLPVLMLCSVILASSFFALWAGLPTQAVRLILMLPVPIILALGVELVIRLVTKLSVRIKHEGYPKSVSVLLGKGRTAMLVAVLLSAFTISGLTLMDSDPYGIHYELFHLKSPLAFTTDVMMVPFISLQTYQRILTVKQYLLANNLPVPIFMFYGASVFSGDVYRAYIFNEIGEHLLYFGDLDNLMNLQPTVWPPSSNPQPGEEQYNFTSVKYLAMMTGDREYRTVTPQISYVTSRSDLLLHPLVFVYPEFYNAPLPSYVLKQEYKVEEGIYVVPSASLIETFVNLNHG
jgi:hypothetical protein